MHAFVKKSASGIVRLVACWLGCSTSFGAHYLPSPEPGWPQFRGPHRNGVSVEKGLLPSWPEGGPRLLWRATNLGAGYSSPIICQKTIYITGDVGNELHLLALDLSGNLLWKATNGAAWSSPYPGARSSCTYAAGRLFHMNAHGRVACFDAAGGREIWHKNVIEEFDSRVPTWGMAESLLVDGGRVIVTPGGRKSAMAALDAQTGAPVWTSEPLASALSGAEPGSRMEGPSYVSPVIVELFGKRQIVGGTARHFMGANADTGKLEWSFDMPTRHEVLATSPVLCGDAVFVTGPDADGGKLLRFVNHTNHVGIEQAWGASLDTLHG